MIETTEILSLALAPIMGAAALLAAKLYLIGA